MHTVLLNPKAAGTRLLRAFARPALAVVLAAAGAGALGAPPSSQDAQALADLVNAYRASPGSCRGRPASRAAPLLPQPALAAVRVTTGTMLEQALEDAGFVVDEAQAISVSGPPDAAAALAAIEDRYCTVLLNPSFTAIGTAHTGNEWQIVLARPFVPPRLGAWPEAGRIVLAAVNAARAQGRRCGDRWYPAVPPVTWNQELGEAALEHSRDMAVHRYFDHRGTDGTLVGDRALRAGYSWRRVGENIASGTSTPEEAVAGWLESPGHCTNVMNGGFTDMGAAYVPNPASKRGTAYWTQVFAAPR
jgi:uncharacterized protein YkwD